MKLEDLAPDALPDTFVDHLRQRLGQHAVKETHVLLAVSGGADSVALLRGICLISLELQLAPQVVHVNHRLRGAESDADADWVRELCHSWNVPCVVLTADVAKCSAERGVGIEEAARDARYELLTSAAEQIGSPVVLLAHTADDQAETVLHHVLRGTGLAGLSGMPSSRKLSDRVRLVRPLLDVDRTEIERFLQSLGQDFRTDSSNLDTALTRNFLRHELLPLLEQRINPQVREQLLRLAQQAFEWRETLEVQATRLLDTARLDDSAACIRLRVEAFRDQPRHLVREAFSRLWVEHNWPRQAMTFAHWESLAALAQSGEATQLNLPGRVTCTRRGGLIAVQTPNRAS